MAVGVGATLLYPSPARGGGQPPKAAGRGLLNPTPARCARRPSPCRGGIIRSAHASAPVFFAAPGTPSFPRLHGGGSFLPSKCEGMARQAARHCSSCTCRCRHVAPFGAPSQRRYGAGPRFLTNRFALPPALSFDPFRVAAPFEPRASLTARRQPAPGRGS
jgi:hypothetical protein